MLGELGKGRSSLALRLVLVGDGQQATEVRIAAEIASDEDQLIAVDLERAADDRFDAELAAGLKVAHSAVDPAAVGDGERGHLELRSSHGQLIGVRPAVEEREVGMAVQLDIGRHRLTHALHKTRFSTSFKRAFCAKRAESGGVSHKSVPETIRSSTRRGTARRAGCC